jgi:NAD(P)-dependent dehydrogenase (short-subunit alcohol dehydrogenase family)
MAVPFNNKGIAEENGAETKPIVVITGSTRGLGFALTAEFLLRNCRVMISGRSGAGVERALPLLIKRSAQAFGGADFDAGTRLRGRPCDVTEAEQVQALWDAAAEHWGGVDVWINNAGIPQDYLPVRELNPAQVRRILETNLLGVI